VKSWEIIADDLSKAGRSYGYVSAVRQIQKVSAQLAAASPSRGGLEASKFATGRIRGGGPAPQVVNNP
jgi:hypothetical protein